MLRGSLIYVNRAISCWVIGQLRSPNDAAEAASGMIEYRRTIEPQGRRRSGLSIYEHGEDKR
jgi:hypothetical protein